MFRYHPDPLASGSVTASDAECESCGRTRGYAYTGPTYAVDKVETLCPWCIADGSAAATFEASFTDVYGAPDDIPEEVLVEVAQRTPGFSGWQQERWLYHCGDATAYVGRIGWAEAEAVPGVAEMLTADGWAEAAHRHLSVDGDLVGYLFRCLHCGTELVYADAA